MDQWNLCPQLWSQCRETVQIFGISMARRTIEQSKRHDSRIGPCPRGFCAGAVGSTGRSHGAGGLILARVRPETVCRPSATLTRMAMSHREARLGFVDRSPFARRLGRCVPRGGAPRAGINHIPLLQKRRRAGANAPLFDD